MKLRLYISFMFSVFCLAFAMLTTFFHTKNNKDSFFLLYWKLTIDNIIRKREHTQQKAQDSLLKILNMILINRGVLQKVYFVLN